MGLNLSKILHSNQSNIKEVVNQWLLKVFSQENQLEIYLPFIDKMGYLIPGVLINIKNNNFLNQSIYAKIIFSNNRNASEGFSALIDQQLNIICASSSSLSIFNVSPELLKLAKCNLSQILENNYKINDFISDNGVTSNVNAFYFQCVEGSVNEEIKYLACKGECKGKFMIKGTRIGEDNIKGDFYILDSKMINNRKHDQIIGTQKNIDKSNYFFQFENSKNI